MKKLIILFVFGSVMVSSYLFAESYSGKVSYIRSPDGRPCLFVTLSGINNVDGTGSSWFVISQKHLGYSEIYGMIVASKMSNKTVKVHTAEKRNQECSNHAEVNVVEVM
ncbi:hypothetical protein M3P05_12450 [Sansalvadorimonas sp. 2012CJ34-2]|uniref:Secreted protein n=1 Tax=Parendozoicomonas callyspongiae TaxID=2942213 RepID=A0ABT0PH81_9GAMM|nr:hypothetical protein [Sansalvadorimonas sp. 2012CJ34-2]MCL6270735.1 hypothetical protein [Sansalvadorimonas sp. 2012CJ34-2]